MNAVIVYIGANQMKRFIVLLLGCLTIVRPSLAASHLALYFHQLESTPTDDAARTLVNQFPAEEWSNFKTMNLSEEIPVLAEALKSARPVVALFAGQQLWVAAILLSADANALNQLQTLMPLMEMNFNDPRIQFTDSDLPEEVIKTQNPMPWRVPVISFAALTHAPISPRLLKNMEDALSDPGPTLVQSAADTLALMKPLPKSVLEILIARMADSPYSRGVINNARGRAKVDDPDAVRAIMSGLTYSSTESLIQTNDVRQSAAWALGQIGSSAIIALPTLRALARNPNEAPFTREQAQTALDHLEPLALALPASAQ